MNRRRKKLILKDLQFKVVFITLFVASFVLLINFQLLLAALWSYSVDASGVTDSGVLLDQMRGIVVNKFFISLLIAIPLSISVAILYSFRFCGPIYRFKKYFNELVDGAPWNRKCGLRSGDHLMDLCRSINDAVGQLGERVHASHEVLQEVGLLLDESVFTTDEATRQRVARITEAIAEEAAVYQRRMGSSTETAAEASGTMASCGVQDGPSRCAPSADAAAPASGGQTSGDTGPSS